MYFNKILKISHTQLLDESLGDIIVQSGQDQRGFVSHIDCI